MDALPSSPSAYVSQVTLPARAAAQFDAMDPRALGALKSQSRSQDAEQNSAASKSAAKQVESMFIQNMLKQFRQSSKPFESGVLNSSATESYRQMYDQQLSQDLANPGLGMAVYFEQAMNSRKKQEPGKSPTDVGASIEKKVASNQSSAKQIPIRKIGEQSGPKQPPKASEITLVLKALRRGSSETTEKADIAKVKSIAVTDGKNADPFLPNDQQKIDLGFYEPLNEVITSISIKNKDPQD